MRDPVAPGRRGEGFTTPLYYYAMRSMSTPSERRVSAVLAKKRRPGIQGIGQISADGGPASGR